MSKPTLGDAPIQQKYIDRMNEIARVLDVTFNGEAKGRDRKVGFVLMVYPFNDEGRTDGRCNYISNGADRRDVVVLMKEMIARFQGQRLEAVAEIERLQDETQMLWDAVAGKNAEIERLRTALARHGLKA